MISEIYLPEIKTQNLKDNTAVFIIEPLYPGYGITLGSALRRVLLSSLPGAAVTEVKVKGATHEFTTLPGVKEDLVNIILNLKSLRLKLFSDKPARLILKAKGKREVTASDIKKSADVEIVNPNLYIATLSDKSAELEMEMKVEKGRGYWPVEAREDRRLEVGTIAVDALYTPVVKVSHKIERTRVGKITNLDKLILEITTDGTITPQEALEQAAQILVDQFSLFLATRKSKTTPRKKVEKRVEKLDIEALDMSPRTTNALLAQKITDTVKLAKLTEKNLEEIKGLGKVGIGEIKAKLKEIGLSLKRSQK